MLALIQARMSSRRLPGKVLAEVGGRPLLCYLIERLQHCRLLSEVAIATSENPSDDPVATFAARWQVRLFRGSLDDVLLRFVSAAQFFGVNSFVRVNGDSPLLDPALVDYGVSLFDDADLDLVTNVHPRSFPKGQSVEVVAVDALRRAATESREQEDREHVTRYIYNNPGRFRIMNFACDQDLSQMRLSVDTPGDLATFRWLIGAMTRPHWEYAVGELSQMAVSAGSLGEAW